MQFSAGGNHKLNILIESMKNRIWLKELAEKQFSKILQILLNLAWVSVRPLCSPAQCYVCVCFQRQVYKYIPVKLCFYHWSILILNIFFHFHNRKEIGQVELVGNIWSEPFSEQACQLPTFHRWQNSKLFFRIFKGCPNHWEPEWELWPIVSLQFLQFEKLFCMM